MNPITQQFLEQLWSGNPAFGEIEARLESQCKSLSPIEAAVIGKDLINRRLALFNRLFKLAAFLASDGEAGNDGFLDFTDCVAFLPEDRYLRVTQDPDSLIDDSISKDFDELYLISKVSEVFDRALLDDRTESGFLDYLVADGSEIDWNEVESGTEVDAIEHLPRLYTKYGHLLRAWNKPALENESNGVSLADLISDSMPD